MFRTQCINWVFILVLWANMAYSEKPQLAESPVQVSSSIKKKTQSIPLKVVDLNAYVGIRFDVTNTGDSFCRVVAQIGESWQTMKSAAFLHPKDKKSIHILFKRNVKFLDGAEENFPGMNGIPAGGIRHWIDVDFSKGIKTLNITIHSEDIAQVSIENIVPFGQFQTPKSLSEQPNFFPFVDTYGQYQHEDWPNKIKGDSDFKNAIEMEKADLAAHPAPANRSVYGGWIGGPKLRATGHFRMEKLQNKWWFIDPDGYLFWSYGVTGVSNQFGQTLIEGREKVFSDVPSLNGPWGEFSKKKDGDFEHRRTHSFGMANLKRKYGDNWRGIDREMSQKRISSWGLNTLGMWSEYSDQLSSKQPYVVAIHFPFPKINKDLRCPDAFNPELSKIMMDSFERYTKDTSKDAYNLGYFICNELQFAPSGTRKKFDVCDAYLQQDLSTPGRQAILNFLKGHYLNDLDKLNKAWATTHETFEDIQTIPFDQKELGETFESLYSDKLYAMFRKCIKALAPDKLYLGSRFVHTTPDHIMEAAAPHMDVFSINWYQSSPANIHMSHHVDKPVIIGEFHFGAVELGVYNPGLVAVGTQQQRADNMYYYYQDALLHRNIVGAHWFQFRSQAFTGRKDGECYQIGMVDITDNPNPEQVEKLREMGKKMYSIRSLDLRL